MGGIWRKMPITFGAWMVSTAALCGVPFFSGFFSKDEIIDSAKHADYTWFYFAGIIGAFMTTAYMTRATYLTFFGEPRGGAAHYMGVEHADDHGLDHHSAHPHEAEHADRHLPEGEYAEPGDPVVHAHDDHGGAHGHVAHGWTFPFAKFDSPWQITAPLIVLGVLAFGSGYLNAPALRHPLVRAPDRVVDRPADRRTVRSGGEEGAAAVTELALGSRPGRHRGRGRRRWRGARRGRRHSTPSPSRRSSRGAPPHPASCWCCSAS